MLNLNMLKVGEESIVADEGVYGGGYSMDNKSIALGMPSGRLMDRAMPSSRLCSVNKRQEMMMMNSI